MTCRRYVELFAGAGGLSLGLERADWGYVAHAEIDPHARAVLRRHWTLNALYGDVTTLDATIALCTFALGGLITITDARRYRAQANRRTTRQEHDV
jgi:site-specific DNA-cytosine methylase